MSFEPLFATARSGFESPLKSLTATEIGRAPAEKLMAKPRAPVPLPSNTEMLVPGNWGVPTLATATSERESPLKSPMAIEVELPAGVFIGALNPPLPFPSRTETLLELQLATARSARESLLNRPQPPSKE